MAAEAAARRISVSAAQDAVGGTTRRRKTALMGLMNGKTCSCIYFPKLLRPTSDSNFPHNDRLNFSLLTHKTMHQMLKAFSLSQVDTGIVKTFTCFPSPVLPLLLHPQTATEFVPPSTNTIQSYIFSRYIRLI